MKVYGRTSFGAVDEQHHHRLKASANRDVLAPDLPSLRHTSPCECIEELKFTGAWAERPLLRRAMRSASLTWAAGLLCGAPVGKK